jgi:hypothetical protein
MVAEERVIDRDEVIALVFIVADISATLKKLYRLLGGEDDEADE